MSGTEPWSPALPDLSVYESEAIRAAWTTLAHEHPGLKCLSPEAIESVRQELQPCNLARREVLFFEDELGETAYILLQGILSLTYLDSRHRRGLFTVMCPGDVIGANPGVPESLGRRLRADAFTDCVVGRIDRRRLIELLFGTPYERFSAAAEFVFGSSSERLAQIMVLRTLPLRERLLALMAYFAARFGIRNQGGVIINLPLTHADLADMVGASRPKVSHQLGLLQKEGLLLQERHRIALNYDASLPSESKDL